LYQYYKNLKELENLDDHYEIILGEYKQKPHFDIDIDLKEPQAKKHDSILDSCINSIQGVFKSLNLTH